MLKITLKLTEKQIDDKPICEIHVDAGKPEEVEKKATDLEKTYANLIIQTLNTTFNQKQENKEEK